MKILFVAPWIPSRLRPRSLGLLRHLAGKHTVTFVGVRGNADIIDDIAAVPLERAYIFPTFRPSALGRSLMGLLIGTSLQNAYARVPAAARKVRTLLDNEDFDAVHANVVRCAGLLPKDLRQPLIYDLDEYRSDFYFQVAGSNILAPRRLVARIEGPRLMRLEREIAILSSAILFSSPSDVNGSSTQSYLVRSPHEPVPTTPRVAATKTVLFVGRLSYWPNVVGLTWFVHNAWPGILRSVPDATLQIVGANPPSSIERLASRNIEIVGPTPNLEPYYHNARTAIVPIQYGTGVQMKLIQALAAGVPCVATSRAVRNAGATPGIHALQADTRDQWITSVVRTLTSDDLAQSLHAAGAAWATEHYANTAITASLDHVYGTLRRPPDAPRPDIESTASHIGGRNAPDLRVRPQTRVKDNAPESDGEMDKEGPIMQVHIRSQGQHAVRALRTRK